MALMSQVANLRHQRLPLLNLNAAMSRLQTRHMGLHGLTSINTRPFYSLLYRLVVKKENFAEADQKDGSAAAINVPKGIKAADVSDDTQSI